MGLLITYAQAYLEAFRLPVNKGDNSARNLINDLTFSASPANKERKPCKSVTVRLVFLGKNYR